MTKEIKCTFDVPAIMRDGTTLYSNIFQPDDDGEYPVALTRSPYGKDMITSFPQVDVIRFAQMGYIVVVQDVRGRGKSDGVWNPYTFEVEDGYDTVEWAAELPGSNGNVGMWGFSYLAYTQWAAAELKPPHLKAMVPAFSFNDARKGLLWRGGALEFGLQVNWLLQSVGIETYLKKQAGNPDFSELVSHYVDEVDRYARDGFFDLPLKAMEWQKKTDLGLELFPKLLENPDAPLFSKSPFSFDIERSQVSIPSMHVGGWYDVFLQGTIDNFVTQQKIQEDGKIRLIIGPWTHLNYSNVIGDMDFGMRSNQGFIDGKFDYTTLHALWFDQWLKGKAPQEDHQAPVQVFLTGANRWHEEQTWPPKGIKYKNLYLDEKQELSETPISGSGSDEYVYDPGNPIPVMGGNTLINPLFPAGVKDQRVLDDRTDIIHYTGNPLERSVTVLGPVSMKLWVNSSAPETDFIARLIDVHPDGFAENLADGILRVKSSTEMDTELTIDMWSVGHVFKKGHKIRVDICSSSFPRWDRNLNTGEIFGEGTSYQSANQIVYYGVEKPSRIILPVID